MSDGAAVEDAHRTPRTLAGATILQIVSALREEPNARTAINVAQALLRAGARALVAGAEGPLVAELRSFGAEWISLRNDSVNPLILRRNVRVLERLIASERVDIVHAQNPGGAWSARQAASGIAVWLVTTLPDVPPEWGLLARSIDALARGDRIIAPSIYAASPVMQRFGIPREQVTVIPRAIDTDAFDPAAVAPQRVATLRDGWRVPAGVRIVLTPGRVAPWNGQIVLPEVARMLANAGLRDVVFVIVGENRWYRSYARAIIKQARTQGVAHLLRLPGHCPDMPAAFAAADMVVVPAIEAPILGRTVAQAQAMARPVITANIGVLPEHLVAPPQFPEDVRTGWVTTPGDPNDLARALMAALAVDAESYKAMSARARQFAEYMFSARSVAVAHRSVYTSLLAREL
jgi:glycosyltransferase involved in cell wall biosynthesis